MSEEKKTVKKEKAENFNIDEALERLEEINNKLSEKDIALNESIELYKEGTLLASKCKEQLQGIEKELKILNE
ncbi:MAG: exodeoxyribonuclease VII small subunit [Lachnospiraceae bacterium]|jgi:exodeoxyribonuclease VII small subunit|nr:exodeoxyribonuclease VII small subunit [Lachnospiraceae bacterium]